MTSSEAIRRLREAREKATPGKWVADTEPTHGAMIYTDPCSGGHLAHLEHYVDGDVPHNDARFIVIAENTWNALLDVVEAAWEDQRHADCYTVGHKGRTCDPLAFGDELCSYCELAESLTALTSAVAACGEGEHVP